MAQTPMLPLRVFIPLQDVIQQVVFTQLKEKSLDDPEKESLHSGSATLGDELQALQFGIGGFSLKLFVTEF